MEGVSASYRFPEQPFNEWLRMDDAVMARMESVLLTPVRSQSRSTSRIAIEKL